jgi:AraC-like DNA-binding protein
LSKAKVAADELEKDFIKIDQLTAIVEAALDLTALPHLGLLFGRKLNAMVHGMVGLVAMACPNSLDALRVFARFNTRANAPFMQVNLIEEDDRVLICFTPAAEVKKIERFILESAMASCVRMSLAMVQKDSQAILACELAAPLQEADRALYESELKVPVSFNRNDHRLIVKKAPLLRKNPMSNPALLKQLTQQIQPLPREQAALTTGEQVLALFEQLDAQVPPMTMLARHLHLSARSLSRRLAEEGSSYQKLVDQFKSQKAVQWLDGGCMSVAEIAFRLDYADTSAFAKAFKRWHGQSPSEFRQSQSRRENK